MEVHSRSAVICSLVIMKMNKLPKVLRELILSYFSILPKFSCVPVKLRKMSKLGEVFFVLCDYRGVRCFADCLKLRKHRIPKGLHFSTDFFNTNINIIEALQFKFRETLEGVCVKDWLYSLPEQELKDLAIEQVKQLFKQLEGDVIEETPFLAGCAFLNFESFLQSLASQKVFLDDKETGGTLFLPSTLFVSSFFVTGLDKVEKSFQSNQSVINVGEKALYEIYYRSKKHSCVFRTSSIKCEDTSCKFYTMMYTKLVNQQLLVSNIRFLVTEGHGFYSFVYPSEDNPTGLTRGTSVHPNFGFMLRAFKKKGYPINFSPINNQIIIDQDFHYPQYNDYFKYL